MMRLIIESTTIVVARIKTNTHVRLLRGSLRMKETLVTLRLRLIHIIAREPFQM